jgi:hypothetical protein
MPKIASLIAPGQWSEPGAKSWSSRPRGPRRGAAEGRIAPVICGGAAEFSCISTLAAGLSAKAILWGRAGGRLDRIMVAERRRRDAGNPLLIPIRLAGLSGEEPIWLGRRAARSGTGELTRLLLRDAIAPRPIPSGTLIPASPRPVPWLRAGH